jgi:hypothetical protein
MGNGNPPGAAETVMRLSQYADFVVNEDRDHAYPMLQITDNNFILLLMPFDASEGGLINPADLANASRLVMVASGYRDALTELYQQQQGVSVLPPRRRPRRPNEIQAETGAGPARATE